jgi:hypothetical protein
MIEIKVLDTEKELLRDFFDTWEEYQSVMNKGQSHAVKVTHAERLVIAANRVRNFDNPVDQDG